MEKLFEKIIKYLRENIESLQAVYLYGSVAQGVSTNASDMDIAIYADKLISNLERWEIQSELSVLLNEDIDLLDLKSTSDVMRFQVVSKGKIIWKSTLFLVDEYENLIYSMYLKLNDDRSENIKHIKK